MKSTRVIKLKINLKELMGTDYDKKSGFEYECFVCNKTYKTVKGCMEHLWKHSDKAIREWIE